MHDMLDRVEAALDPFFCSSDRAHGEPRQAARAAIKAMRYRDGADESSLIKVSNAERVEAISLSLAWDAMIDEALGEVPVPEGFGLLGELVAELGEEG